MRANDVSNSDSASMPVFGDKCDAISGILEQSSYQPPRQESIDNRKLGFESDFMSATFLITHYDLGIGSHSALLFMPSSIDELPLIFDPNGSFLALPELPLVGQRFGHVDLQAYIEWHRKGGTEIDIVQINTTADEQRAIINRIELIGDVAGLACATTVSDVLDGACGISGSFFPGFLRDQAEQAKCK
jgi:hypothetical protein